MSHNLEKKEPACFLSYVGFSIERQTDRQIDRQIYKQMRTWGQNIMKRREQVTRTLRDEEGVNVTRVMKEFATLIVFLVLILSWTFRFS